MYFPGAQGPARASPSTGWTGAWNNPNGRTARALRAHCAHTTYDTPSKPLHERFSLPRAKKCHRQQRSKGPYTLYTLGLSAHPACGPWATFGQRSQRLAPICGTPEHAEKEAHKKGGGAPPCMMTGPSDSVGHMHKRQKRRRSPGAIYLLYIGPQATFKSGEATEINCFHAPMPQEQQRCL